MIQNDRASRHEHVLDVARQMMTAARTAPKGKGVDIISYGHRRRFKSIVGQDGCHGGRTRNEVLFAGCRQHFAG